MSGTETLAIRAIPEPATDPNPPANPNPTTNPGCHTRTDGGMSDEHPQAPDDRGRPPGTATGPTTEDGKNTSKRNASKHGLTGSGEGLAPEDAIELQRRTAAFADCLKPADPYEQALVRQLALADFRIERCGQLELAATAQNRRRDGAFWHEDRWLQVAAIRNELAADPLAALMRLRRSSHGCQWLIHQFQDLDRLIQGPAAGFTPDAQERLLDLLGVNRQTRWLDGTTARVRDLAQRLEAGESEARAALRQWIAEAVAELGEQHDRVRDEVEWFEWSQLERGLRFDDSPPLRLLRRYGGAAERMFARASQQLETYRNAKGTGSATSASESMSMLPPSPPTPDPAPPPPPPRSEAASYVDICAIPNSDVKPSPDSKSLDTPASAAVSGSGRLSPAELDVLHEDLNTVTEQLRVRKEALGLMASVLARQARSRPR